MATQSQRLEIGHLDDENLAEVEEALTMNRPSTSKLNVIKLAGTSCEESTK